MTVRVLVCEDNALTRSVMSRLLSADPGIQVMGRLRTTEEALEALRTRPGAADVLVLGVAEGLPALKAVLGVAPGLRVILAGGAAGQDGATTRQALRLGAADTLAKPPATAMSRDTAFQRDLLAKVRGTSRPASPRVDAGVAGRPPGMEAAARAAIQLRPAGRVRPQLLAIGSSTGGPQALVTFVQELRARLDGPLPVPGVLTQHMPPTFTPLLAEQVSRVGGMRCIEAAAGTVLLPGTLYLAPGGRHLLIDRRGGELLAKLDDGPAENFCKPSVDPMLRSATASCDGRVLMVMLTGMGQDGLLGTRAVVEAGGAALAQDEASSIVWGMPGAIARAGLCQAVLPIPALADRAARILGGRP